MFGDAHVCVFSYMYNRTTKAIYNEDEKDQLAFYNQ